MKDSHVKLICSEDIVYSEHDVDECLEYRDGSGRVSEGDAVGVMVEGALVLFGDIKYSSADHRYWDNHELEFDTKRVVLPE